MSIVVTMSGLTLLIFGRRIFRIVLFPLVYLLAMVPIWDAFTVRLHPIFQLYSARIGVYILQAMGIPVLREGVSIELPNVTLEVAQACSGINYLIAKPLSTVVITLYNFWLYKHWVFKPETPKAESDLETGTQPSGTSASGVRA